MNMKVYGLLGMLLCNVICMNGMSRPFFTSTPYNVESSDKAFNDKLDLLQTKLAELQSQINQPLIKSWLMWGGKVALVAGGVSLTSYLALRYFFDLGSQRDVENAFNEVRRTVHLHEVELQCGAQEGMQTLQSTITQQLDDKKAIWHQLLQDNNGNLDQHMNILRDGLLEVKNNMNQSQNKLNDMMGSYFEGQQAQIDEFGRQIGLSIAGVEGQVEQQIASQQEQLGAINQVINGLRKDTSKLVVDTINKRSGIEYDRYLINQLFANNPQSSLLEN